MCVQVLHGGRSDQHFVLYKNHVCRVWNMLGAEPERSGLVLGCFSESLVARCGMGLIAGIHASLEGDKLSLCYVFIGTAFQSWDRLIRLVTKRSFKYRHTTDILLPRLTAEALHV